MFGTGDFRPSWNFESLFRSFCYSNRTPRRALIVVLFSTCDCPKNRMTSRPVTFSTISIDSVTALTVLSNCVKRGDSARAAMKARRNRNGRSIRWTAERFDKWRRFTHKSGEFPFERWGRSFSLQMWQMNSLHTLAGHVANYVTARPVHILLLVPKLRMGLWSKVQTRR
jgi:hypothetical protein